MKDKIIIKLYNAKCKLKIIIIVLLLYFLCFLHFFLFSPFFDFIDITLRILTLCYYGIGLIFFLFYK